MHYALRVCLWTSYLSVLSCGSANRGMHSCYPHPAAERKTGETGGIRYRRLLRGKSARPKRAKSSVDGSGTALVGAKAKMPTEVRQATSMPLCQVGSLSV